MTDHNKPFGVKNKVIKSFQEVGEQRSLIQLNHHPSTVARTTGTRKNFGRTSIFSGLGGIWDDHHRVAQKHQYLICQNPVSTCTHFSRNNLESQFRISPLNLKSVALICLLNSGFLSVWMQGLDHYRLQ